MTRQLEFRKNEPPLSQLTRDEEVLDSNYGYRRTDIDGIHHNQSTNKWRLIEEKNNRDSITSSQRELYNTFDKACQNDKNHINFKIIKNPTNQEKMYYYNVEHIFCIWAKKINGRIKNWMIFEDEKTKKSKSKYRYIPDLYKLISEILDKTYFGYYSIMYTNNTNKKSPIYITDIEQEKRIRITYNELIEFLKFNPNILSLFNSRKNIQQKRKTLFEL